MPNQEYVDIYSYSSGNGGGNKNRKNKNKKKMAGWKKALLAVFCVLLILTGSVVCIGWYFLSDIQIDTEFPKDDAELGITEEALTEEANDDSITNIALYGIDTRTHDDQGHADATMILSVDKKHNKLKLISILRDTQVQVEGYGKAKITTSYWWGGAPLAIKTLNQNFNMNVRDYVRVNFDQLAEVVDAVGGVQIDVSEEEIPEINSNLHSIELFDDDVSESGMLTLNGNQAVAYARIRNVGSDVARASRQQEVLSAIFTKVQSMGVSEYPSMLKKLAPLVTTSLDYGEMLSLASIMVSSPTLETYTIPGEEENAWGGIDDGAWVWQYDLDAAGDHIKRIIYETDGGENSDATE